MSQLYNSGSLLCVYQRGSRANHFNAFTDNMCQNEIAQTDESVIIHKYQDRRDQCAMLINQDPWAIKFLPIIPMFLIIDQLIMDQFPRSDLYWSALICIGD